MADAGPVRDQALGILATAASGPVFETSLEVQTGQSGPVVESDLSIVTDGYYLYDILVFKNAAFNPDVVAWMQFNRAWLPSSVDKADVLALYDPCADRFLEFGQNQELTPFGTGSISFPTFQGLRYAQFDQYASLFGAPFATALADASPFTVYTVAAPTTSLLNANYYPFTLLGGSIGSGPGIDGLYMRNKSAGGAQSVAAVFEGFGTSSASTGVSGETRNEIYQFAAEFSSSSVQLWRNQTTTAGPTAHTRVVDNLNRMEYGGTFSTAATYENALFYSLAVAGSRNLTVETEIAARFPVGEVLP